MNTPASSILKTGFILNEKWVIIELIGKGAMGEVYRAHQLNLKRDVAIKVISLEMLQSFEEDPVEIENAYLRFRREVQAMARIRHPNVLQIYDYGSETIVKDEKEVAIEYIIMELIPGATLRHTMSEEGFDPDEKLVQAWLQEHFLPLLNGVEAIHGHDIIHRDLKPENVLLDGNIPKIADFGIARTSWLRPVTQSVDVKGTPAYMSPEHFFDFKKADRQSDIYSLGKILFEAISGKISRETIPFKSVQLSRPETPFFQKLDRIIQDATAEEKSRRPNTVAEFRTRLQEALQLLEDKSASPPLQTPGRFSFLSQPRFIWAGIITAVLSVLIMGLWHLLGQRDDSVRAVQERTPAIGEAYQPASKTPDAAPTSFRGRDGIVMRLVPGGRLTVASQDLDKPEGYTVEVPPFYVDETRVTNHHFVEFLNAVKGSLTVSDGIVRQKDRIWLYLGSGTEPHEQIIYEQGRFLLRKTEYAAYPAYPVVRVSWYAAQAYAAHYGKRLLTEYEWDYGVQNDFFPDKVKAQSNGTSLPSETHPHMRQVAPDSEDVRSTMPENNKEGDAAVHQMASSVPKPQSYTQEIPKEWISRTESVLGRTDDSADSKTHKSLVADRSLGGGKDAKAFRYPWEAFANVGFRSALSASALE